MTSTHSPGRPAGKGPLAGIRVLELGNFIAAPYAGKIFAEFGAEVIKVERPGDGDELRGWRAFGEETSMMFRTIGRNKRSVTLDLRSSQGQQLARQLGAECDVVLENFRPGTLERWNLGPDQLQAANPELVLVRISGYGQTGPYRERAGFGGAAEAFGGLRHITGRPDEEPCRAAASIGDVLAGLYGVIGALMMMLRKARTGPADSQAGGSEALDLVDVALYESVFSVLDSLVPDYDAYGVVRERSGGKLPGVVPSDAYRCKDGASIVIGGNANGVFIRLMEAIGRFDLAHCPSLQDGPGRAARADELEKVISEWAAATRMSEALDLLHRAGVPAGAVMDAAAITADPHYAARGMLQPMEVGVGDEMQCVRFPGVVPKIAGVPDAPRWIGPDVGEDTDTVLTELTGATTAELSALRADGVI